MGSDGENVHGITIPHSEDDLDEAPLSREEEVRYRAIVARLKYLSQDRSDIQFSVKEMCRHISSPTQGQMARLKRLGRYIKKYPRVINHFRYQDTPQEIKVWTDSDHAGC